MTDLKTPTREPDRTNERGAAIWDAGPFCNADRYEFDFKLCLPANGWKQYDTDQDAWYYGVWVHLERRLVVCYAEGDVSICQHTTDDGMRSELEAMAKFHGDPPPMAVGIDADGSVTAYYDERPTL